MSSAGGHLRPEAPACVPVLAYLLLWPLAVLAAPAVWGVHPLLWALYTGLVLAHFMVQVSYFMHEAYHHHFARSAGCNRLLYKVCCLALVLDPQVYALAHERHHGKVHTTEDWEFFPRGAWANPGAARRQLALELLLGQLGWVLAVTPTVYRHPRHSRARSAGFLLLALATHGGLHALAAMLHPGRFWVSFWSYGLALWVAGLTTRWLQFAEHLGTLAPEGTDLPTRIGLTRVLRTRGWGNRLWHLWTLFDSEDHAAHHAWPRAHTRRLFPWQAPRPPEVGREIDLGELPGIVAAYWRRPAGVRQEVP